MQIDDFPGSRGEHIAVRRTLARLGELAAGDPAEGSLVAQLRHEVDYHVQKEETEFLPELRASLDQAALDDLTRRLDEARAPAGAGASAELADSVPDMIVVGRRTGIFGRLRGRARSGSGG